MIVRVRRCDCCDSVAKCRLIGAKWLCALCDDTPETPTKTAA